MIDVYDFCKACADGTTVKLMFFDVESEEFITTVILADAKTGCKALSVVFGYSHVEYIYNSADVITAKVRVHACDM